MSKARIKTVKMPRRLMEMSTPALVLHTKGANVPHITREVFDLLTEQTPTLQIPLMNTHQMQTAVSAQGKGIGHFAAYPDLPTYVTFNDPATSVPQTPMEKFTLPLWTRNGKMLFDTDKYMTAIEAFKPDMYEILHDGCTDKDSSKKRLLKSVDRSNHMFTECIKRHRASDILNGNSLILAPIAGGYSVHERQRSLNHILTESSLIDGFVLDGFNNDAPNLERIFYDDIKEMVEMITSKLPDDKFRVARGSWNALTLLDLVSAGWDLFDTSMPYLVTERGSALVFSFDVNDKHLEGNEPYENSYEINLNDTVFKEDFEPILNNCNCLACKNHSRAYINHLLNTNELLSGVLLMVHNLHHYMEYFKAIKHHISSDTVGDLRLLVEKQYRAHKVTVLEKSKETIKKKARVL